MKQAVSEIKGIGGKGGTEMEERKKGEKKGREKDRE